MSENTLDAVWQRVSTLELLLDKSNTELRQLIENRQGIDESEILRWQRAMFNLKRCHQSMTTEKTPEPTDLSWTYWNGNLNQIPDNPSKSSEIDTNQVPLTPFKRGPLMAHRFTKKFQVSTCDYCNKQMFFGLKCIECKYSCHKDCESCVPPSCGVPIELMSEFKHTFNLENSNHLSQPSPDIVDAGNGFFFSTSRSNNKRSPIIVSEPNSTTNQRRSSSTLAMLKNYFEELSITSEPKKDPIVTIPTEEADENPLPTQLCQSSETISSTDSIALSIDSVPSDSTEDRQSEWVSLT